MKTIRTSDKNKRGARGAGRLFKKAGSKQLPADSTATGNYYLTYTVNGKRITQALRDADGHPITDRAQAENERRRILAPYAAGDAVETLKAIRAKLADAETLQAEAVEKASNALRISDAWRHYESHPDRPQAGDATMRQYGFQWQRFLKWMLEHHPEIVTLSEVAGQAARAYHGDLRGDGLSAATVNKHISLLRLVFSTVNKKKTTNGDEPLPNPFDGIRAMQHRVKGRRELTAEELRRVVDAASGETKLLLAIGIYTGLRLGDCATLRWDEVDFAQGFIIRIPNKTAASDKAVRIPIFKTLAAMLADARPKTRQAYVLPEAARLYQGGADAITGRIQRLFWNAGIDCHAPGTGSQIKRDADGNPETIEGGNVALTQTGNRAVVRCGFHSLRHTFVSLCREAGAPLSVVEAIVGHSNPAMTRHYSHTSDAEATRAVAALPDITNGTPAALPAREPVPAWIREALATMTGNNWREVRAAILEGGAI